VEKQSLIGSERKEYDSIEAPKSRYRQRGYWLSKDTLALHWGGGGGFSYPREVEKLNLKEI
jgi:hypothetical protein